MMMMMDDEIKQVKKHKTFKISLAKLPTTSFVAHRWEHTCTYNVSPANVNLCERHNTTRSAEDSERHNVVKKKSAKLPHIIRLIYKRILKHIRSWRQDHTCTKHLAMHVGACTNPREGSANRGRGELGGERIQQNLSLV